MLLQNSILFGYNDEGSFIEKGGTAMLARERHKLILELLKRDGTVRNADLV